MDLLKELEEYINLLKKYALKGTLLNIDGHSLANSNFKIKKGLSMLEDKSYLEEYEKMMTFIRPSWDIFSDDKITINLHQIQKFTQKLSYPNMAIILEIDDKLKLLAPPFLIHSTINELIKNASKNGATEVTIKNTGNIIIVSSNTKPPKRLDKIFDLGYSECGKIGSKGVGLFLLKEVLEKYGFTIVANTHRSKDITRFVIKEKNPYYGYTTE